MTFEEVTLAPVMFIAGYQAMQAVKYTIGLILLISGKNEAWAWWHREILGL